MYVVTIQSSNHRLLRTAGGRVEFVDCLVDGIGFKPNIPMLAIPTLPP